MVGLKFTIQEHILFCLLLRAEGKSRMIVTEDTTYNVSPIRLSSFAVYSVPTRSGDAGSTVGRAWIWGFHGRALEPRVSIALSEWMAA